MLQSPAGGVPERFNGAVLKTVVLKGTGSSNLSSSAFFTLVALWQRGFFRLQRALPSFPIPIRVGKYNNQYTTDHHDRFEDER
jgi:hypothetical protein